MKKNKILIVDDTAEIRRIIGIYLNPDYIVELASCAEEAEKIIENVHAKGETLDLILLDVMMPGMSGFDFAGILKSGERTRDIPIIFITALNDVQNIVKGFEAGGADYVSKPFKKAELLARVRNHCKIKNLQDDLRDKNLLLQNEEIFLNKLVEEKTLKIESLTIAMVKALENANYLNDDDTGSHIIRVKQYSRKLALKYGCDSEFVKKISLYASLHDVGKVGIDPDILKKKGPYTTEEREKMKAHVKIGYNLLNDENIDEMAKNIALYHHEKWDGTGYCAHLLGEEIPLEARIVAFADVYDALTTKRVYKPAFDQAHTNEIIRQGKGKHFDPQLVEFYFEIEEEFLEIKRHNGN